MQNHFLKKPISNLNMIGDVYGERLNKLGINTIEDLLHHYPFRYEDRNLTQDLTDVKDGDIVTLSGAIVGITNVRTRNGKQMQKATFVTGNDDNLEVVWFNQPYLVQTLQKTPEVTLSGKIKFFRDKPSLTSPTYELVRSIAIASASGTSGTSRTSRTSPLHTGRLIPIYHLTAGVSSKWLRSRISPLLKENITVDDWLPKDIKTNEHLVDLKTALKNIHFPESDQNLEQALHRLKFDELLLLQLTAQLHKLQWRHKQDAPVLQCSPETIDQFISKLPFQLTPAQRRCLNEICQDLQQTSPMNRLLQGDVGSGKTVLAAATAYISAHNGLPAVIMAPTEVLALQHAHSISQMLKPFNLSLSIQTRSRKDTVDHPNVIIGTHAILHRQVPNNLGVLVIDEQHRFGVEQRAQLLKRNVHTPHVLSMTATPIPRTIALTLYADLDISVIDEMPPGRKPVTTWVVSQAKRQAAYNWIKSQILSSNTQAFVVCPLIQDSETPALDQVKAAESEYEHLKTNVYPDLNIGLVHGNMNSKVKQQVIQDFAAKKYHILVATPVIEVGIDIPNATIMLIEGAERFGLAALHQLRGRVGRGDHQSYCLLFSSGKQPSSRLKHLERIHAGYELAQLDLKLRGSGNLYGIQQSGHIDLKIASLQDQNLLQATYRQAINLIQADPKLTHHQTVQQKIKSHLEKHISPN